MEIAVWGARYSVPYHPPDGGALPWRNLFLSVINSFAWVGRSAYMPTLMVARGRRDVGTICVVIR
jgi:hypothetical protein